MGKARQPVHGVRTYRSGVEFTIAHQQLEDLLGEDYYRSILRHEIVSHLIKNASKYRRLLEQFDDGVAWRSNG